MIASVAYKLRWILVALLLAGVTLHTLSSDRLDFYLDHVRSYWGNQTVTRDHFNTSTPVPVSLGFEHNATNSAPEAWQVLLVGVEEVVRGERTHVKVTAKCTHDRNQTVTVEYTHRIARNGPVVRPPVVLRNLFDDIHPNCNKYSHLHVA
jgi:hypothetical protein